MKKRYYLLIALCSVSFASLSQILNENNVNTSFYDNGFFFTDSINSTHNYEVPAGNGTHAIFSGALWFGGTDVNGQVKLAAQQYAGNGKIIGEVLQHVTILPNGLRTIGPLSRIILVKLLGR